MKRPWESLSSHVTCSSFPSLLNTIPVLFNPFSPTHPLPSSQLSHYQGKKILKCSHWSLATGFHPVESASHKCGMTRNWLLNERHAEVRGHPIHLQLCVASLLLVASVCCLPGLQTLKKQVSLLENGHIARN